MKEYNKLVRDKIPEIIEKDGHKAKFRTLSEKDFFIALDKKLLEEVVSLIADKNKELMEKMGIVSKKTLREKILAYLSIKAQQQGTRYFDIPLGRVELADYLCANRSALTRELSKMKVEGLLDYEKNMFHLLE